jgi:hypothetical protein
MVADVAVTGVHLADGREVVGLVVSAEETALAAEAPLLPEDLFKLPHAVLAAAIKAQLDVQEFPVDHYFAEGVAARELAIPAGTLATARRHLTSHICILSAGEMTIWEEGKEEVVIEAPFTFVVPPGTQFAGYAHRDSVWTTIFPNPDDCRDEAVLLDRNEALPDYMLAPGTEIPQLFGGAA